MDILWQQSLLAGAAYFLYVFFKAFQQRNVAFDHYAWVLPISYAMSFTEVLVISLVAHKTATTGLTWELAWFAGAIGTGGGTGALLSMWIHKRYIT